MRSGVQLLGTGVLVLFSVTGCPVTDDYFIEAHHAAGAGAGVENTGETGSGAQAASSSGGATQGGSAQGGSAAQAATAGDVAVTTGGVMEMPVGGTSAAGQPADAGAGGVPATPCVPTTERCNGHDDDCDELVDELACNTNANGTTGCTGFTIATNPNHGYMLCTGTAKDYTHARDACAGQEMHLAWLESAEENTAVAATIKKLTNQTDILFGATDSVKEGDWYWDGVGGFLFWRGEENGAAIGGNFNAWAVQTPNNNNNEDCAVMNPTTAAWGDRNCFAYYTYVCEEQNP
jgi:Lectin C-type domain